MSLTTYGPFPVVYHSFVVGFDPDYRIVQSTCYGSYLVVSYNSENVRVIDVRHSMLKQHHRVPVVLLVTSPGQESSSA